MGLLLLLRILVPAPAVHIVGADRRVVVPRDSRNPGLFEQRYCLVRPWRIPDQVAEMIRGVDGTRGDVVEDRSERREVGVNVGDQRVAHDTLRRGWNEG